MKPILRSVTSVVCLPEVEGVKQLGDDEDEMDFDRRIF